MAPHPLNRPNEERPDHEGRRRTPPRSIRIPTPLYTLAQSRSEALGYTTVSAYIRDLIRADTDAAADLELDGE